MGCRPRDNIHNPAAPGPRLEPTCDVLLQALRMLRPRLERMLASGHEREASIERGEQRERLGAHRSVVEPAVAPAVQDELLRQRIGNLYTWILVPIPATFQ